MTSSSDAFRPALAPAKPKAAPHMPAIAVLVEEPAAQAALAAAAHAAVHELNRFLAQHGDAAPQLGPSAMDALRAHLGALLQGRVGLDGKPNGPHPVLLGSVDALGAVRAPKSTERVTVATATATTSRLLFFALGLGFVPLSKLEPGNLFGSADEAAHALFGYLRDEGLAPRDFSLRTCLVNFPREGPAELSDLAPGN